MSQNKLFLFLLFIGANTYGQSALPISTNLQATYKNETRTINGQPGKNYWQNTADYNIKINFNPLNRLLKGTVAIDYINNSPDTLRQINFKLYPNLYKKGSIRNMAVQPDDLTDGVQIEKISINQQDQNSSQWKIDGTEMNVQLAQPLAPKQKNSL